MADGGAPKASKSPQFDIDTFARRLRALYDSWQRDRSTSWNGASAFAVATPPPSDDMRYLKSTTLQIWLLGYEFPETVVLFLPKAVHVICSSKKATYLVEVQKACQSKAGGQVPSSSVRSLSSHAPCEDAARGLLLAPSSCWFLNSGLRRPRWVSIPGLRHAGNKQGRAAS